MRIIATKRVLEFRRWYPDARTALDEWLTVAKAEHWHSLQDVRRHYPSADGVVIKSGRVVTIFNIRGNKYRLLTGIHYDRDRIYILRFYTHAEYDKNLWKEQL